MKLVCNQKGCEVPADAVGPNCATCGHPLHDADGPEPVSASALAVEETVEVVDADPDADVDEEGDEEQEFYGE